MKRLTFNPDELKDSRSIGYNHGIIANGTFYMAGQVAMNSDSEVVGDDIETQARKTYENLGYLLRDIGKDFDDVAKVITYIVDADENYYDGYKEVYWEAFDGEQLPCHTVIGVDQLANEDYLVEVEIEVPLSDEDVERLS